MQGTNCPINDYLKVTRTMLPQALTKIGECRWQVILFRNRGPQIQHQFTPFEHHLVRLPQSFFKDWPRRLVLTELRRRCMKSQQQTLDSLKKSVMQVLRDSSSLVDTFFQTKFYYASCYGPGKKGGNEKGRDCRYRHDKKNPPLNASHFQDGLRKFGVGVLLSAADQC